MHFLNQFFALYVFRVYLVYQFYLFAKYIVYKKIILPFFWKPINYKELGQWAIVTGCTDGIGKGFTIELAKKGMDLVLISRSITKLEDLSLELKEKFNVKTKIIVVDFKKFDDVRAQQVRKELQGLDIGVLINNVGVSFTTENFLDHNKAQVYDLINVNIKATVTMSSIVMESMVNNKRGLVINVSSILAVQICPEAALYGASKAFILKYSKDLHDEYKRFGVTVHCLITGPVRTNMWKLNVNEWSTPTPDKYAESALNTIGREKVTTGYWSHDVIVYFVKLLSDLSPTFIVWIMLLLGIHARKYKTIGGTVTST